jgi:hypothetical protein
MSRGIETGSGVGVLLLELLSELPTEPFPEPEAVAVPYEEGADGPAMETLVLGSRAAREAAYLESESGVGVPMMTRLLSMPSIAIDIKKAFVVVFDFGVLSDARCWQSTGHAQCLSDATTEHHKEREDKSNDKPPPLDDGACDSSLDLVLVYRTKKSPRFLFLMTATCDTTCIPYCIRTACGHPSYPSGWRRPIISPPRDLS